MLDSMPPQGVPEHTHQPLHDLASVVGDMVAAQLALGGYSSEFHYGQLPVSQRQKVENILAGIHRGRIYDRRTQTFELPPVEFQETDFDHVVDLLESGRQLQQLSTTLMYNSSDPEYFGLAQQVDWSFYTTAAVFHDIGEGGPGDLPRSYALHEGEADYQAKRVEYSAAEAAFFDGKVLPIFRNARQRTTIGETYRRYEHRIASDIPSQLLHIIDKVRGAVSATIRGTQEGRDARQGGIDSALGSLHDLMPYLSPASRHELEIFLSDQFRQIPDMPHIIEQLHYSLEHGASLSIETQPPAHDDSARRHLRLV